MEKLLEVVYLEGEFEPDQPTEALGEETDLSELEVLPPEEVAAIEEEALQLKPPDDPEAVVRDPVAAFHKQAAERPHYTRQQMIELAKRKDTGDEAAFREMVESNLRLVASVGRRYRYRGDFADILQEGTMALVRVAKNFDWRRGNAFSTPAVPAIKNAMTRFIDNHGRVNRRPVEVERKISSIAWVEPGLMQQQRTEQPTPESIAELTSIPPEEVVALQGEGSVMSLSTPVGPDSSNSEFGDFIADETAFNEGHTFAEQEELGVLLKGALDRLVARERRAVELRFGLGKNDPKPYEFTEIADALDTSVGTAYNLVNRGLTRLKKDENLKGLGR